MPAQLSDEEKRVQLCTSVCRIFEQAGNSVASHGKNFVALYKIHIDLAEFTESFKKGKRELFKLVGEKDFQDTFKGILSKTLPLRKGETIGDRVIKFVGGYVKYANEKAIEGVKQEEGDEEEDTTTASRFTAHLLNWLLAGFLAKDKNVRFRVLQTVAEMIAHLGAIDEDDYKNLRASLIDRLNDREWVVRYQAVISLAKLCGTEDPSELSDGEQSILSILLATMTYDPSPEVRRAVLVNIPIAKETLPAILDRTKDTDNNMRKAFYDSVMEKNVLQGDEKIIGPTHPRALSIQQRELVVRNGLGDREPAVRAVAASLLATWVDVADMNSENNRDSARDDKGGKDLEKGVLAFLTLFDLAEGTVAADALPRVFQARVDIFDNIEFDDEYWSNLTPEKAFLARVFVEYCKEKQDNVRLEATLPVVTSIAFRIQEYYNLLQDEYPSLTKAGLEDSDHQNKDDEIAAKELVLAELLNLAVSLDYSDEIGRRKMFQLVRDMLLQEKLPLKLMGPCLDVMSVLSTTERDLIRLVVETIQELRRAYDDDEDGAEASTQAERDDDDETPQTKSARESIDNMTPEQRARVNRIDLRCLSLCQRMLERVNSTFEENIMLDGVLRELIIPSVQRKDEVFRDLGVKCLGLCCLIARRLALSTMPLFMSMIPSAPPNIKITLVQCLFDILMVHESAMFKNQDNNLEALTAFLLQNIEKEQDPEVKATFCKGTSKLVLSGMLTDINVVKNLIKAYISPATVNNQDLRQCLAFFLPTYSHSSPANQKCMREIFIHVFLDICQDRKEMEGDDEIIGSSRVAAMFVDWTDPLVLSQAMSARGGQSISGTEEAVHLDLAEDVLKTLFEKDLKIMIEKEDKRVLCQLLNKLHIPDTVDDYKILSLKLLVDHLCTRRPLRDTVCNTALAKFETTIVKKFEKQLEHFSEEEFRKLEELNDLFNFLDSIIPLDDDETIELDPSKRSKKRRSESVVTITPEAESYSGSPLPEDINSKRRIKRPRISSEGEDQYIKRDSMPPPKVPTRTRILPRRAAAAKKPVQPIIISSDSEDLGEISVPSIKQRSQNQPSVKDEEAELDKDIHKLLGNDSSSSASTVSETPCDSIMGPNSEGEEDEVNGLLAE